MSKALAPGRLLFQKAAVTVEKSPFPVGHVLFTVIPQLLPMYANSCVCVYTYTTWNLGRWRAALENDCAEIWPGGRERVKIAATRDCFSLNKIKLLRLHCVHLKSGKEPNSHGALAYVSGSCVMQLWKRRVWGPVRNILQSVRGSAQKLLVIIMKSSF